MRSSRLVTGMAQLHLNAVNGVFVLVQFVFSALAEHLTDFTCCHPHAVLLHEAQHMHDTTNSPMPALLIA